MDLINLWWLCLGALIGWLVQWAWDWAWFRGRRRVVSVDVETQVSTLRAEREQLAADLRACGDRRVALEGEVAALKARGAEYEGLRARVGELEPLSARVEELAAENAQLGGLRARVGELEPLSARVEALAEENARLRAELEAAPAPRGAELALGASGQGAVGDPEVLASLREYNVSMYDELDATRRALARYAAGRGDPLIDIDGIGPVYQQKLYEQGVVTFDQLATMHPDRLRSLVAPNAVFALDTQPWIEQARRLSGQPARDPLIDINGVGPVYEQRLLNAGVTSFEQLAAMTAEEIRAIIRPEPWQLFEPEKWIAEARELARQVRAGTYQKGEY
ncbi:MAG TPA: helix-hairpin-helix domain-containing protein [Chloroflexaceae bacterium]|mgnify:CR=1 FL=1|nr:helix-hairpin-helix domain-containing protein [Chloroflexaceae bacterium]